MVRPTGSDSPVSAERLLRQPEIRLADLVESGQEKFETSPGGEDTDRASVESHVKYAGYIERLSMMRPETLGQAGRVPGVTPAAVAVIGFHLERWRRSRSAPETDEARA